jgi:hypothetical protein
MRRIVANTVLVLLAVLVAVILIAPQIDLDPALLPSHWAACLMALLLLRMAASKLVICIPTILRVAARERNGTRKIPEFTHLALPLLC